MMTSKPEVFMELDLGTSDCETCGTNYETVEVLFEDGGYRFRLRAGCYSGSEILETERDRFVTRLKDERDYFTRNFWEHTADFDAMIAAVTTHVPAPAAKEDDRG
jgi:hypothetical protein